MIRLIVADDHTLVRAGIVGMLKSRADMDVVAEAGTSTEAIALCLELKPDILLLDLNMPDMDGLEATRRLQAQCPAIKILVLTMHESEDYALRLLRAGASGFLVKGISPEELPDAIRKVAAGDMYITESIMKRIAMRQALSGRTDPENPLACLSNREMQVFVLMAKGKSFQNVSDELNLSISTVGTYKSRIMEKLNLNNNSELVRLAMRLGFVDRFD